jgi:hypothetical protein
MRPQASPLCDVTRLLVQCGYRAGAMEPHRSIVLPGASSGLLARLNTTTVPPAVHIP